MGSTLGALQVPDPAAPLHHHPLSASVDKLALGSGFYVVHAHLVD